MIMERGGKRYRICVIEGNECRSVNREGGGVSLPDKSSGTQKQMRK